MMSYKIHSQADRLLDVSIDDGAGVVIRKKMDLQPYIVDEIVSIPHPEKEGEFIQALQPKKIDPFDDLPGFFGEYISAYKRGVQVEKEAQAPKQVLEETFYFVPQEANSEVNEAAAE